MERREETEAERRRRIAEMRREIKIDECLVPLIEMLFDAAVAAGQVNPIRAIVDGYIDELAARDCISKEEEKALRRDVDYFRFYLEKGTWEETEGALRDLADDIIKILASRCRF